MISISLPREDENIYISRSGCIVGPLHSSGKSVSTTVSYRSDLDTLAQGRTMYHENDVEHSKVEGYVRHIPAAYDTTLYPEGGPYARKWTYYSPSAKRNYTVTMAFALESYYYRYSPPGSYGATHTVTDTSDPYCVKVWSVTGSSSSLPMSLRTVQYAESRFSRIVGNTVYYRSYTCNYPGTLITTRNWNNELDASVVRSFVDEIFPKPTLVIGIEASYPVCQSISTGSASIPQIRSVIDSLAEDPSMKDSFLETVHFGDLAMTASQSVNRNPVNMIAFLKDLRRPKELIPKLKNLRKLKTHAGNYLGMNYGILPTIDDIRHIIEALKKRMPYFDRNGFSVYTASHVLSGNNGIVDQTLTQRVKLAIENEDSELQALASRYESSGFALTLENVWDLIPYSFVLDWFIDIGGFLERVDTRLRLIRFNIRYVTMSQKNETTMRLNTSQSFPFIGTLKRVNYRRWTTDRCPNPPLFPSSTPTVANHWLEASALLVQRAK